MKNRGNCTKKARFALTCMLPSWVYNLKRILSSSWPFGWHFPALFAGGWNLLPGYRFPMPHTMTSRTRGSPSVIQQTSLSSCYGPDTVLGTEDRAGHKTDRNPCPSSLHSGVRMGGRQETKIQVNCVRGQMCHRGK